MDSQTVKTQAIEIRSAHTGTLLARADGLGVYFFDRRSGTEKCMNWDGLRLLREAIERGEFSSVRIDG